MNVSAEFWYQILSLNLKPPPMYEDEFSKSLAHIVASYSKLKFRKFTYKTTFVSVFIRFNELSDLGLRIIVLFSEKNWFT